MVWLSSVIQVLSLLLLVTPGWSSTCQDADWWLTLDNIGWSVCPAENTYIRGLYRNEPEPQGAQGIYLIEEARCCQALEPSYADQDATCTEESWTELINSESSQQMWAECPRGYFLNGFKINGVMSLSNFEQAKCCRPQNHPNDYDGCYDEDVTLSFDMEGWSECSQTGYLMTGFYKGGCSDIYCIEKLRCCKMKSVNGGWSEWGDWGECSSSCDGGQAQRTRSCTNPPPSGGGIDCSGSNMETKPCNMASCQEVEAWNEWSSTCQDADWWLTLDNIGWSVCPAENTYLRGLYRNEPEPQGEQGIYLIEEARCCQALEPSYADQDATCTEEAWTELVNSQSSQQMWAECPRGYFLNGFKINGVMSLSNFEQAKCCRPQNHPNDYEGCYDEDVTLSFDMEGWSECSQTGYLMTGFYKGECSEIYCLEKLRCCKMKSVNGGWSDWGDWGECSSSCDGGQAQRTRSCTSPPPSGGGIDCSGSNKETKPCNMASCQEVEAWNEWSSTCQDADWWLTLDNVGWSVCPAENTYLRGLYRNEPEPQGEQGIYLLEEARCCQALEPGYADQDATCTEEAWTELVNSESSQQMWAECPRGYFLNGFKINGVMSLSNFEQAKCCRPQNHPNDYEGCYDEDVTLSFDKEGWSECSQTGYLMTGFYKGGCSEIYCIEKFRCCKMKSVDGGWSEWGDWGGCTRSCGSAEQERSRSCTSPSPLGGGADCSGRDKQARFCDLNPCPVDGGWSKWGVWGDCTQSCASGEQERSRSCSSPSPSGGGADCSGDDKQMQSCNVDPCPVNGAWSEWGDWGDCTQSCGSGEQERSRSCTSPSPSAGGADCNGDDKQTQSCNVSPCAVNGAWSEWGDWGDCTQSCASGEQERSRSCTSPSPSGGGADCSGDDKQTQSCNVSPCPVNGAWSEWGDWGECSESCGDGTRERSRSCTSPPPSSGGAACSGDDKQTEDCSSNLCTEAFLFAEAGTTDFIRKYNVPNFTSLTVCLWMKSDDQQNKGTPLSYSYIRRTDELKIYNYNSFQLVIGGSSSGATSVSATDGNWHHICVTWENGAGEWKLYKDGVVAAEGQGLNTDHVVHRGGTMTLGQSQDHQTRRFIASESFVGEMTGVNIWDHVIDASEIASLAESCSAGEGNVFPWSIFTRYRQLIHASSCPV